MFVGYALVRSEEDLRRLLVWNLVLAGVVSIIGIIQAIVGPDFMNPATMAPEIAVLGRLYRDTPSGAQLLRPDSVFVSDGRFALFLIQMWILGLGTTVYLVSRLRRGRRYVMLGLGALAGAILLSGSRNTFVHAIVAALVVLYASLRGGALSQRAGLARVMSGIRRVALLVAVAMAILILFFPEDIGSRWAFYSETLLQPGPGNEVARRAWTYPISELLKSFDQGNWLYGHGTGTASLGVGYVVLLLNKPRPGIGVESGYGCLLLEMGILGPILWIVWSGALLHSLWKVVRRLRGTPLYSLGFAILWFVFLILFPFTFGGLQSYQNFIVNAYLWLLVGVLFRLPDLAGRSLSPASPQTSAVSR
jgi:hypothetical protein